MDGARKHKMLGEILIEQGAISQIQLNEALKQQRSAGCLIGEALLRLGFVKEEDIVIALATQFNFPYLPIDNFEINPQAVKSVSADICSKYICIPIDKIKSILTVVMSDPANQTAIKEIEDATGCHVQPFVATVTEIKKAIRRCYRIELHEEAPEHHVSRISFQHAAEKLKKEP